MKNQNRHASYEVEFDNSTGVTYRRKASKDTNNVVLVVMFALLLSLGFACLVAALW